MNIKCSDPNIKGTLYVGEDLGPSVTISFEEDYTNVEKLQRCIKTVKQILENGNGVSVEVIIETALSEIEKVKDLL